MPPSDLLLAALIMAACSLTIGSMAYVALRRSSRAVRVGVLVFTVMAICAYAQWGQDAAWLARLLETPLLPVVGVWYPIFVAISIAVLLAEPTLPHWRAILLGVAAVTVTGVATWHRLWPSDIAYQARWRDGVCLQTIDGTCSAAACATLLAAHSIPSSEARCGQLALTQRDGTTLFGMVRALLTETRDQKIQLRVAQGTSEDLYRPERLPALVSVALTAEVAANEPRYESQWHWTVGQRHTVVLFGWDGERAIIGDPAVGHESWHRDGLTDLWTGRMVWLEKIEIE